MRIENEITFLVAEKLDLHIEEVAPESEFVHDLGADSLDLVELLMAVEEKYNIDISDEDAKRVITVQGAIDYLKKRGTE